MTQSSHQPTAVTDEPENPLPYKNDGELFSDLYLILDGRLAALVEELPARHRPEEINLRGLVTTDEEARRLLDKRSGSTKFSGGLWDSVEGRVVASHRQGIALALAVVRERFHLSNFEVECLVACIAPEIDARYQKLYGYLNDDVSQKYPSVDLLLRLLVPVESSLPYRNSLVPSSILLRSGLLAWADDNVSGPLLGRCLRVDSAVVQFLLRDPKPDPDLDSVWLERDFPAEAERLWAINSQAVTSVEGHLASYFEQKDAKRDRLVISLTGRPGSGRRHAIESSCARLGFGTLALDCSRLIKHSRFEQILTRAFCCSLLHAAPMLLGNFDAVLQNADRGQEFRAILDRLLEERGWILFVLRDQGDVGANWFQRYKHVNVHFPDPTVESRKTLWTLILTEGTGLRAEEIQEMSEALSAKFRLTPGQIAIAFRRAAHAVAPDTPAGRWRSLLHANASQISTPRLGSLARKIKPLYHATQLILPAAKMDRVRDVIRHVEQKRTVMEQWGFGELMSRGKGLTVLFSGLPGTGKTMAAEVIANELGMDLYRIDLSGVVSKYIGETEKNLARIFQEAEHSDAILFFDEADALFGKRSEVKDAHDRYANIEINYLLQQIEDFEGVAILATNMRQHLDDAFLRRMQVVVEFPVPSYEDRLRIWRQCIPPGAPLSADVDFHFLAFQFELAGGYIANIALWSALLASEEDAPIGMRHFVMATRREFEKIGRRCMKEEFGKYARLLEHEPCAQSLSATAH